VDLGCVLVPVCVRNQEAVKHITGKKIARLMTTPNQSESDRSRDQVLAGEYVLGVLSPEACRGIEARIARDATFAATVRRWEDNLSVRDDPYSDPKARLRLQAHFPVLVEKRNFNRELAMAGICWNSITFWRLTSIALFAGIVTYAAFQSGWLAP
jgi:anti-sigma-K factor RskA